MSGIDPARIASEVLGGVPLATVGLRSGGKILGAAAKTLLGVDLADQEIPFLGEITDGLTVAAGIGSLVASAFDIGGGGDDPGTPPKETAPTSIGGSYGV